MEEGIIARALNYHWPPNTWGNLTIPQLVRIYAVERKIADSRPEPPQTAPPMYTGSDTADDEED